MLYFSTIFDYNYLTRALSLYDSMSKNHKEFILYIVCLDDQVYSYFTLRNFRNVRLIKVSELEAFYPELIKLKSERSKIDYIFTLSPYYPSFILENSPEIPFICSLDVDQFFFSSCRNIFEELEDYSVLIMPHKYSNKLKHLEEYGKYNVSFQVFKNDFIGNECLKLWRRQCFEWCKDVLEDGKYADQKYLDEWVSHFGNKVKSIEHPGIGLAPWNLDNYVISLKNKYVFVDGKELVLYHYQGLRFLNNRLINSGITKYNVEVTKVFINHVLQPIIKHLSIAGNKQKKQMTDTMSRIKVEKKKGILNNINSEGMYYLFGSKLINLDKIYRFKRKNGINGLFDRFKNFYR